jgi:hypothetical protein
MFDLYFIAFLFFFSIGCLLEIIAFNEEILLSICFFSFIFFCFNSLGDSVFSSFNARAEKFETDLLVSFSFSRKSAINNFNFFLKSKGLQGKIKIILSSFSLYLTAVKSYSNHKFLSLIYSNGIEKLQELLLIESKLITSFQKESLLTLLYPFVFTSVKTNKLLENLASNSSLSSSVSSQASTLKFLSM